MDIRKFFQSLNPKLWVIGALKAYAIREVEKEGDSLQARLKLEMEERGAGAIDSIIDRAQGAAIMRVMTWGPRWRWLQVVREPIGKAIQEFGDNLQESIKREAVVMGPRAVDFVFDAAQDALIEKIKAL